MNRYTSQLARKLAYGMPPIEHPAATRLVEQLTDKLAAMGCTIKDTSTDTVVRFSHPDVKYRFFISASDYRGWHGNRDIKVVATLDVRTKTGARFIEHQIAEYEHSDKNFRYEGVVFGDSLIQQVWPVVQSLLNSTVDYIKKLNAIEPLRGERIPHPPR
jgi:hypothetical protein